MCAGGPSTSVSPTLKSVPSMGESGRKRKEGDRKGSNEETQGEVEVGLEEVS